MAKANPPSSLPTPNKVFAGKTFVLQGDFGKFPRTHINITRLIVKHGGRVHKMVTDKTTHLVTTIEEFKKRPPSIEKAITMGKGRCRIVQWEYIEDSIFTKNGVPKAVSANFHEIQSALKRQKKFSEAKEIYKKKFIQETNSTKGLADPGLHHHHIDATGFNYLIKITRLIQVDSKSRIEKYTLILFESNAFPRTYMLGARFNRPGHATRFIKEFMVPTTFDVAFKQFKHFFKGKTGIEWDQRLDGVKSEKEDAFVYIPPPEDEPRGALPWKKPQSGCGNDDDEIMSLMNPYGVNCLS